MVKVHRRICVDHVDEEIVCAFEHRKFRLALLTKYKHANYKSIYAQHW